MHAPLVVALAAMAVAPSGLVAATLSPYRSPEMLAQAERIRAEVDVRCRLGCGRKLAVTEASTTAVVASLTLLGHPRGARVVPASHGIYFALCAAAATCPYPARSSSWAATAPQPLRAAVELAVRAFRGTRAGLVVVALPTRQPVWLVLERGDIVGRADWPALRTIASRDPSVADASLVQRVDQLSRRHLFAPVGLVSVSRTEDTLVATALAPSGQKSPDSP